MKLQFEFFNPIMSLSYIRKQTFVTISSKGSKCLFLPSSIRSIRSIVVIQALID